MEEKRNYLLYVSNQDYLQTVETLLRFIHDDAAAENYVFDIASLQYDLRQSSGMTEVSASITAKRK